MDRLFILIDELMTTSTFFSLSYTSYGPAIFSKCLFLQVDWGEASMIQAERILLQHALMDPLNERFVFLSDR